MKLIIFAFFLFAATIATAKQVPLDIKASEIQWKGEKKLTDDSHHGSVKIKKGTINIDEQRNLVGGTIVIDMKSIEDKDLSGKWKTKLEQHLNSEDFFDVSKHPEASFKITKVEPTRSNVAKVTGNLTLRGVTHPETFEIIVEKNNKKMTATGQITVDRTKYGVTYNQEGNLLQKAVKVAKDKIIKNNVVITINLKTQTI